MGFDGYDQWKTTEPVDPTEEPEQEQEPDELDAAHMEIDRLRAELEVCGRDLALANATIDDLIAARGPKGVDGLTKYQHTVIEMAKAQRVAFPKECAAAIADRAICDAIEIWKQIEGVLEMEDSDG